MEFRILGPLEVVDAGGPRVPAGGKERAVLARLLLEPGRPVPADALLEAAWPDAPRAAALRSLQVRLASLRGFLEPDRPRGAPSGVLVHGSGGYRLAVGPGAVDAHELAALLQRTAGAAPAAVLAACDAALGLWRGEPFPELCEAECVRAERERLHELRAQAGERRLRALVDLGMCDAALPDLRRLVAIEPWKEELVRSLAVALYRTGRQVDALEAIRALAAELRELGLDPSPATRELEGRILRHEVEPPAGGEAFSAPLPAPAGGAAPVVVAAREALPAAPAVGASPANAAAAPPPPAGRGRAPAPASRFVGREDDLRRAEALLAAGRLLTVTGVGGAGKTRLALALAARLASTGPDGAWWCELAPLDVPDDVPGAVADALGLAPDAGPSGLPALVERLAPRRALLLLDNCEHVLDGAAGLVEQLLAACPELRIVCTSRAPLGVEGERVLRLAGLEQDAAEALFADRARAAGALADPAAEPAAVAEVCRRLDGLPLALELAAGRTRAMTVPEIAAALDGRFRLLVVPGRRAPARHATLRAAIDWSYELLGEPQRRVFERVSVFHRGCTLAAAQDVCDDDLRPHVQELLDELVAHSMLSAEAVRGRTRYRMLESLREYAAARLAERGDAAVARDRHADHFVRRIERALAAHRSRRAPGLPYAAEFDDVRAAVRWCVQADPDPRRAFVLLGSLWSIAISRHAEEIAPLAEEALARHPGAQPDRLHALGTAATARMSLADTEQARAHARRAIELEAPAGVPALVARRVLSGIDFQAGDLPGAHRRTEDLARRARAAGDEPLACEADGFTAQLLDAMGEWTAASALAARLRARSDRLGAPFPAAWSRYVSGVVALGRDDAAATRELGESLALARATGQHHMIRFNLRALGVADLLAGRHDAAADHLLAALDHHEAGTTAATRCATLTAIGALLAARQRDEPAAVLLAASAAVPSAPLLASLAVLDALAARARTAIAGRLGAERLAAAAAIGRALDPAGAEALARAELAGAVSVP